MRVGIGFDVHPLIKGEELILGGVHIPYEYGLTGHSDADVLTHALMDALLGALSLGDIGRYFPDTDGVLHFNDGIHGNMLNTLAILGKKYYDRFGYIYHPKYKSVYADNEFDLISRRLGKCRYFDQMIISHKRKEIKKDRLHKINHRYVYHDKLKYYEWKENNII